MELPSKIDRNKFEAKDKMAMGGLAFFFHIVFNTKVTEHLKKKKQLGKIKSSGYFGIDLFLGI